MPTADVALEADVDPEGLGGWGGTLLDELVVLEVVHHPLKPLVAGGGIGDVYVGGFACHVLAVGDAMDLLVEVDGRTAETTADDYRHVEVLAQGFKDVFAEGTEVGNLLGIGFVLDAILDGGVGTGELN